MRSKSGLDWVHWVPVKSSAKKAQRFSEPGRFGAQEWGGGARQATCLVYKISSDKYVQPVLHCSKQITPRK